MAALVAGDLVLSTGAAGEPEWTRVVVNQHRAGRTAAALVTLHHADGSLSLTADHVLRSDGAFKAARHVAAGATLSNGAVVTHVAASAGGVANPVTVNGVCSTPRASIHKSLLCLARRTRAHDTPPAPHTHISTAVCGPPPTLATTPCAAGKILAAAATGAPVEASTHP
eukprot:1620182-Prymnesium_polylepis.2